MTRVVVIGAGAVGGTIAARLAAGGSGTVVVARGKHADKIEKNGLRLRTPQGDVIGRPKVWRSAADAKLRADDVLVLAVKTQQAQQALGEWAGIRLKDGRAASEALPVLVCLNGVAGEEIALRYFRRVFGVCVWAPCTFPEPGVVASYFYPDSGVYHIGRYPAALTAGDDREFMDEVASAWRAAGLDMQPHGNVMKWKWRKLINNIGNVFDALLGDDPQAADLVLRARSEAVRVIAAAGVEVTPDGVESAARAAGPQMGTIKGLPYDGSSSRQSLARGSGTIEVAYLNGEIVRLAHRFGHAAPINERVVGIAERAVREGTEPGSFTAAGLRAELGLE